jgi:hypothetical protein
MDISRNKEVHSKYHKFPIRSALFKRIQVKLLCHYGCAIDEVVTSSLFMAEDGYEAISVRIEVKQVALKQVLFPST